MTEFAGVSLALNLIYALIAVALLLLVLRRFDKSLGIDFKRDVWREIVDENNVAVALYVGLRFLAICVLLGCIIS